MCPSSPVHNPAGVANGSGTTGINSRKQTAFLRIRVAGEREQYTLIGRSLNSAQTGEDSLWHLFTPASMPQEGLTRRRAICVQKSAITVNRALLAVLDTSSRALLAYLDILFTGTVLDSRILFMIRRAAKG